MREDVAGLRLLYEPGEVKFAGGGLDRKAVEEYRRRREAPLRGAPAGR